MARTYLDDIVAAHRARAQRDTRRWQDRPLNPRSGPSFIDAIGRSGGGPVRVIAEIKRRSPSKGWLAKDIDAVAQGQLYESCGAAAISVLTDQEHFGARPDDLSTVASVVNIPCLRKDFTVNENDVLDARDMGASAVLLIVAMLSDDELQRLHALATSVNLDALVEIHDAREAQRALDAGARIIGVNQRNLVTFAVDPDHAASVAAALPSTVVRVAESGLRTPDDVRRAGDHGFDAVLVGETFVTSATPESTVRGFTQVDSATDA